MSLGIGLASHSDKSLFRPNVTRGTFTRTNIEINLSSKTIKQVPLVDPKSNSNKSYQSELRKKSAYFNERRKQGAGYHKGNTVPLKVSQDVKSYLQEAFPWELVQGQMKHIPNLPSKPSSLVALRENLYRDSFNHGKPIQSHLRWKERERLNKYGIPKKATLKNQYFGTATQMDSDAPESENTESLMVDTVKHSYVEVPPSPSPPPLRKPRDAVPKETSRAGMKSVPSKPVLEPTGSIALAASLGTDAMTPVVDIPLKLALDSIGLPLKKLERLCRELEHLRRPEEHSLPLLPIPPIGGDKKMKEETRPSTTSSLKSCLRAPSAEGESPASKPGSRGKCVRFNIEDLRNEW
jgi:hypothetical protein